MKRFAYQRLWFETTRLVSHDTHAEFNRLGQDGWELVAVVPSKRELPTVSYHSTTWDAKIYAYPGPMEDGFVVLFKREMEEAA